MIDNNLNFMGAANDGWTNPVTASGTSTRNVDLKTKPGTPRRGMFAKVFYTGLTNSSSALPTITAATLVAESVITSASHGVTNGQIVAITGATGNTAINGAWVAKSVATNTLVLTGCDARGSGTYNSGSATGYLGNNVYWYIDGSNDAANWVQIARQQSNPNGPGIQGLVAAPFTIPGQSGEVTVHFESDMEYHRLGWVVGSGGTSPSVSFTSFMTVGRP